MLGPAISQEKTCGHRSRLIAVLFCGMEACGALIEPDEGSRDRAAHKQVVSLMMGERGMGEYGLFQ